MTTYPEPLVPEPDPLPEPGPIPAPGPEPLPPPHPEPNPSPDKWLFNSRPTANFTRPA